MDQALALAVSGGEGTGQRDSGGNLEGRRLKKAGHPGQQKPSCCLPSSPVLGGAAEKSHTAGLRVPRGVGAPVEQAKEGTSRGQRAAGLRAQARAGGRGWGSKKTRGDTATSSSQGGCWETVVAL